MCDSKARIYEMRTQDLKAPLGLDCEAPVFSWKTDAGGSGWLQSAYRLTVHRGRTVVWDSGKIASGVSVGVVYGGSPLEPCTAYTWQVQVWDQKERETVSPEAAFETGLPRHAPFGGARWIACPEENGPLPVFRKTVEVQGELVRARLYTSGLGVYENYVNGIRLGRALPDGSVVYQELKPGFTEMAKRKFYNTYDVTKLLHPGVNALCAVVSSGWWSDGAVDDYGKNDAYLAKLSLTYADGTTRWVDSDETWKCARASAVQAADIFTGETYDARVEEDWKYPSFDDSGWACARIDDQFTGEIQSWIGSPITQRRDLERKAQDVTIYAGAEGAGDDRYGKIRVVSATHSERFVLYPGQTARIDFGQNFAGRESFAVEGRRGTVITVKHGETLNDCDGLHSRGNDGPEGAVYNANYRTAVATTRYTLSGRGVELYTPIFTFYGFRYLELTADQTVVFHSVRGQVVTSVEQETGFMQTSDPSVNRLIHNIRWGQYSNYLSIPTDCPQRDERQGWTADTQVFAKAGCYLGFSKSFLTKFTVDMRDSQNDAGAIPGTAPTGRYHGAQWGRVGWADAMVIVPYVLYHMYGDKTVLAENWGAMQRYVDGFLAGTNGGGPGPEWGDWLAYESNDAEIQQILGVVFYAWDAKMMAEMAQVLGKSQDAERYRQLFETEKALFIKRYVNQDGTVTRPEQTICAYALYLELLPDGASVQKVARQLTENIRSHGNRLQTGFLGTAILLHTLSKIGRDDVAYSLLLQHENPSWLYSVDQGATTIWERWNSYTIKDGFGDVSMNSFNHYAYGSVIAWMFDTMAGIRSDDTAAGFKRILLAPRPDRRLSMQASYHCAYGVIAVKTAFEGALWRYTCVLPDNTTAQIRIPASGPVTVCGKDAQGLTLEQDGIAFRGMDGGDAVFEAVSGRYCFETHLAE